MSIKEVFGENLKYYRRAKRLSQEELAEKVNITPKHLSVIETGASFVSAELLENITKVLEVSAAALFYSPEEKSTDGSFFSLADRVITEELAKAELSIKTRLRRQV